MPVNSILEKKEKHRFIKKKLKINTVTVFQEQGCKKFAAFTSKENLCNEHFIKEVISLLEDTVIILEEKVKYLKSV